MREFFGAILVLGAPCAGAYGAWLAYQRARGRPLNRNHPRMRGIVLLALAMLLFGTAILPGSDRGASDNREGKVERITPTPTPTRVPPATLHPDPD